MRKTNKNGMWLRFRVQFFLFENPLKITVWSFYYEQKQFTVVFQGVRSTNIIGSITLVSGMKRMEVLRMG